MRMRVWLASFPRSGNTFARFVLKELYDVPSDSAYPNEAGGRLARFLAEPRADAPHDQTRFIKTHEILATDDASPAVYVVRDGRDAYVSYAHFARQTDPHGHSGMSFEDVLRMLVSSPDHFGGWSRHVDIWTRRAHTAVLFYEDLLADPAGALGRACAELGIVLPRPSGALTTIDELRSRDPLNFRKGRAASWKEEMPPDIERLFWERHGATMTRLGYSRSTLRF
jgi:hypothetical protein